MKMKILEEKPETMRFVWDGVGPQVANVIRRVAMGDVLTLAIENVFIYENSSVFFDEYVAHRLGLVALRANVTKLSADEKITFSLDKEGPCTVTGADLISSGSDIEVAGKSVPILKLSANQKLRLECHAIINKGETHVKWQPGLIAYQGYPVLINNSSKSAQAIVKDCPTPGLLKAEGNKVVLADPENTDLCSDGFLTGSDLRIDAADDKVIFYLESFGQVSPRDMISQSCDVLLEKNDEFKEQIKKIK